MSKDDQPAFPQQTNATYGYTGMTLRDYFAAKAMQGMLAHDDQPLADLVDYAWQVADAMLTARKD